VLPGNVLYVRLPRFWGVDDQGDWVYEPLIAILRQLFVRGQDSAGVILDIRANPGGFPQIHLAMADWLFPQPTDLFSCRWKSGNGHSDLGDPVLYTSVPDAAFQMTRPLAVLANARSASCADFTSGWMHTTGRGKTFGAASSGAFGQDMQSTDLAGWTLHYSDILCSDMAGNVLEGHPPAPDFPVSYTAADIRQGVDTVIEAARAWVAAQQ
jgi:C-terminal processing protease CtpA/Prc